VFRGCRERSSGASPSTEGAPIVHCALRYSSGVESLHGKPERYRLIGPAQHYEKNCCFPELIILGHLQKLLTTWKPDRLWRLELAAAKSQKNVGLKL
jgi:hypothetical protein